MSLAAVAVRRKRRRRADSLTDTVVTPAGLVRLEKGTSIELKSKEHFFDYERDWRCKTPAGVRAYSAAVSSERRSVGAGTAVNASATSQQGFSPRSTLMTRRGSIFSRQVRKAVSDLDC